MHLWTQSAVSGRFYAILIPTHGNFIFGNNLNDEIPFQCFTTCAQDDCLTFPSAYAELNSNRQQLNLLHMIEL